MINIIKVQIQNFQSHKDTVLEFSSGLNVIIGQSDSGKTAIIRAIKWVFYNEPRGIEFIRNGEKTACVTIQFNNNYSIVRERSQAKNIYKVISPDGDVSVFEGFGNEIPLEVINIHGIKEFYVDEGLKLNLSISDQLEGAFLLSETGAIRAKAIGRLMGLNIIDKAIKDTIIDLKREVQSKDRMQTEVEDLNVKLKEYEELDSLKQRIDNSEGLLRNLESILQRKDKLEAMNTCYSRISQEISNTCNTIESFKRIRECENSYNVCKLTLMKNKTLKIIKNKYDLINRQIRSAQNYLEKSKDYVVLKEKFDKMMEKYRHMIKVEQLRVEYLKIDKNIKDGEAYVKSSISSINQLLERYIARLKKEKKCPLCNSGIDSYKIEEITRYYRGD